MRSIRPRRRARIVDEARAGARGRRALTLTLARARARENPRPAMDVYSMGHDSSSVGVDVRPARAGTRVSASGEDGDERCDGARVSLYMDGNIFMEHQYGASGYGAKKMNRRRT